LIFLLVLKRAVAIKVVSMDTAKGSVVENSGMIVISCVDAHARVYHVRPVAEWPWLTVE
jgi:hypothetical protein